MKSLLRLAAVASLGSVLTGCAFVNTPVGPGALATMVKAPVQVVDNTVEPSKLGESSCVNVLGLVSVGDASITRAADNGGITKIHHVDSRKISVLGIYASSDTIVYGE